MAGSPLFRSSSTGPGGGGADAVDEDVGRIDQRSTTPRGTRSGCRASSATTCTGADGSGKRSDSWNVRVAVFASPVISHSPKIEAKPRE